MARYFGEKHCHFVFCPPFFPFPVSTRTCTQGLRDSPVDADSHLPRLQAPHVPVSHLAFREASEHQEVGCWAAHMTEAGVGLLARAPSRGSSVLIGATKGWRVDAAAVAVHAGGLRVVWMPGTARGLQQLPDGHFETKAVGFAINSLCR